MLNWRQARKLTFSAKCYLQRKVGKMNTWSRRKGQKCRRMLKSSVIDGSQSTVTNAAFLKI